MPLLNLLKRKDKVGGNDAHSPRADPKAASAFTFMRTVRPLPAYQITPHCYNIANRVHKDTSTQEVISPPSFSSSDSSPQPSASQHNNESRSSRLFSRRPRSNSRESGIPGASVTSQGSDRSASRPAHGSKRLSELFGIRKHEVGSSHVPSDLPDITIQGAAQGDKTAEVQWEKRATILAQQNERSISRPGSSCGSPTGQKHSSSGEIPRAINPGRDTSGVVASRTVDEDLQEAIRLHEEGHLEEATKLFQMLADPNGANNALSQVLYVSSTCSFLSQVFSMQGW